MTLPQQTRITPPTSPPGTGISSADVVQQERVRSGLSTREVEDGLRALELKDRIIRNTEEKLKSIRKGLWGEGKLESNPRYQELRAVLDREEQERQELLQRFRDRGVNLKEVNRDRELVRQLNSGQVAPPSQVKYSQTNSLTGGGITTTTGTTNGATVGYTTRNGVQVSGTPEGAYGRSTNPVIIQAGKSSTEAKVGVVSRNNQTVRGSGFDSLPSRETREQFLARTNRADYQDNTGKVFKVESPSTTNVRSNDPIQSGRVDRSYPARDIPGDLVSSQDKSYGKQIIGNALKRQERANKQIDKLFGRKENVSQLSKESVGQRLRGAAAFVPKSAVFALGSGQLIVGEGVLRAENLIRYGLLRGTTANVQRTKDLVRVSPTSAVLIGKGFVEQAKQPFGQGEIAGSVLVGKLAPGTKQIETFEFQGLKIDTIGKTGTLGKGTAQQTVTILAKKETLPFSKALAAELKAAEPDFLVVRGNVQSGVASRSGFGVLRDLDRTFLVRNVFKEPDPGLLTVGKATTVKNPNAGFGFPLGEAPVYPLRSPPRVVKVAQQNPVVKEILTPAEYLKGADKIAKQQTRVQGKIQNVARQGGDYLNPDRFFEKLTPTVEATGQRTGADVFTPEGATSLGAPRVVKELRVRDVEAPVFQVGKDGALQSYVARSVTTDIKLAGGGNPALRFTQEGAAKIVSGIIRPRDVPVVKVQGTGGVPKPRSATAPKLEISFDAQGNPVRRTGGRPQSDPSKSYAPVRVNGRLKYVEIQRSTPAPAAVQQTQANNLVLQSVAKPVIQNTLPGNVVKASVNNVVLASRVTRAKRPLRPVATPAAFTGTPAAPAAPVSPQLSVPRTRIEFARENVRSLGGRQPLSAPRILPEATSKNTISNDVSGLAEGSSISTSESTSSALSPASTSVGASSSVSTSVGLASVSTSTSTSISISPSIGLPRTKALSTSTNNREKGDLYDVFVGRGTRDPFFKKRRRGRLSVRLNDSPLSLGGAAALLDTTLDSTAAASGQVVNRRTGQAVDLDSLGLSKNKYRVGKKNPGLIVEKNRFRINTLGEKRQIKRKGGRFA